VRVKECKQWRQQQELLEMDFDHQWESEWGGEELSEGVRLPLKKKFKRVKNNGKSEGGKRPRAQPRAA
jgi:hypothetical protein